MSGKNKAVPPAPYPSGLADYARGAGKKNDAGKPRWDLLPWPEVEEVVRVLTFGAEKYGDENWRQVPEARRRYFAAAMRHLVDWEQDASVDAESGLPHMAHAICCLLFLMAREREGSL